MRKISRSAPSDRWVAILHEEEGPLANVHKLKVELMTAESFAPFGEVMEAKERPSYERRFFPITFDIDGKTTVDVIWQPYAERTFTRWNATST